MFRKKNQPSIEATRLSSLIAAGVEIIGDVVIPDGLRIDGRVQGNVRAKQGSQGLLVLSEKGCIEGSVKVHDAVINGTIQGDLEVDNFLELQANARITGNITYRQFKMECGATVEGRLDRLPERRGEHAASADAEPGSTFAKTAVPAGADGPA
jgi:cytoskeletal protein CcmA (bactofilin family)